MIGVLTNATIRRARSRNRRSESPDTTPSMAVELRPNGPASAKTPFKIHTRRCRVRRKRERLTSNGSIETDADLSSQSHSVVSLAASLPIEI
jgi:hypothetical protein